ncbi:hypothetical protein ALC57_09670 [Trachymyrmex cornetzi]|uniref:Helix-turn-helix type 11 domain-containing protein n=1 Tax=Trachymyrmex cornetzi TaxID=471704 RepID=A0A195DYP9_9HYME|nr:hypothetical protein ALC57_09670 [Trachymyrmex cornetzi]
MGLPKEYFRHTLLLFFNQKKTNADLQTLLDENPAQSTSELDRELNIDRTTVIKRLRNMVFK